jgi:hypothetical protein
MGELLMLRVWYTSIVLILLFILALLSVGLYYPSKVGILTEHFFGLVPTHQEVEKVDLLRGKYQILSAVISSYAAAVIALVSAFVNVIIAFFIYRNISLRQSTIQRLTYLTQLEGQITHLMNQKLARLKIEEKSELFRFRNVLNEIPWDANFENRSLIERHLYVDGDNFVYIRADGARLSSTALNESMIWFKRLRRALNANIIHAEDLLVFWRYIICFTLSGRYSFFRRYFSDIDWSDMAFVCQAVFRAYYARSHVLPANVINCFDDEFLSDVGIKRSSLQEA